MKKKTILLCMVSTILFASCNSKEKDARQFISDFSAAIASGDTTAIIRMYPDAAKADSLALSFNEDSLVVEVNEAGDTIHYKIGQGIKMTAVKEKNDSIQVISSQGLFAYTPERIKMAKETGWFDPSLGDVQNAERLADTQFIPWLEEKIAREGVSEMKNKVKITRNSTSLGAQINSYAHGCDYRCTHTVEVTNENDFDVSGSDYVLRVVASPCGYPEYAQGNCKSQSGKAIPAHGSVTYTWTDVHFDGSWSYRDRVVLNYNPQVSSSMSDYSFTGNEYAEYLAQ